MENYNYYKSYYSMRKHLYKIRYEEKKIEVKERKELYEPHGGEATYCKDSLIKCGFLKIKN